MTQFSEAYIASLDLNGNKNKKNNWHNCRSFYIQMVSLNDIIVSYEQTFLYEVTMVYNVLSMCCPMWPPDVLVFQIVLGISTLLMYVPIWLAASHQSSSVALLATAAWVTQEFKRIPKWAGLWGNQKNFEMPFMYILEF